MKVFKVTAPDGQVISVEAPEDATDDQLIELAQKKYQTKSEKKEVKKTEKPTEESLQKDEVAWDKFYDDLKKSGLSEEDQRKIIANALEEKISNPKWTGSRLPEPTLAFREQFEKVQPYVAGIPPELGQTVSTAAGAGAGYKLNPPLKSALGTASGSMPPDAMPPSAPQAGASAARPVAGGPAGPVGGPAAPVQPTQLGTPSTYAKATGPGSAVFNYARVEGLPEIEARRALGMGSGAGEVHDLLKGRREALGRIQQMGGGFVEDPRFGGLMTPEPSAGRGPRASFVQQPAIPSSPDLPAGKPSGLSALPPRAPIAPPSPSPLSQVQQLFGKIGQTSASLMSDVLKSRAMGALGGASAAYQGFEALKNLYEGNLEEAALSGLGAVGGGLMMVPTVPTAVLGGALSAAPYLYRKAKEGPSPVAGQMSDVAAP